MLAAVWTPPLYRFGTYDADGPGNANAAVYLPVTFPADATLSAVRFQCTTAAGNFDLALYDSTFTRLAALGSTALTTGTKSLSLSVSASAGGQYYVGLVFSDTGARLICNTLTSVPALQQRAIAEQAAAIPLPASATPIDVSSWIHVPVISFVSA